MANTLLNPSIIAQEALRQLKNNCIMGKRVFRGYEDEWKKTSRGHKIGSAITMKAPVYFRVKDGATIDTVELREEDVTLTVNYRKHVAWTITAQQMTLNIDKFSKRFIQPAMQALANYIDTTLLGLYTDIPQQVGTPGTTPQDFLAIALAQAKLDEMACPPDNRTCVFDPQAQAYLANHLKALFHQPIVGKAVTKGKFGDLAGFEMYMSQNVNTHTNGTWASGLTVQKDGASSDGDTTLAVKSGGTTETALHGDIFTMAAVNAVNPISGVSTGSLRQFVVDADASMDGSGEIAALTATPGSAPWAINSSTAGEKTLPYQNVDTLPQANAALAFEGTTGQTYKANLAFHRDCLALAMVPLEIPLSAAWSAQDSEDGFTIRVIRDYDVTNDQEYIRFDVLFGVQTLNPMLGCRIAGQ